MNEDMRVASMRVIIGTIYPDVMSKSEEEKHRIYNEVYEHVLDQGLYAVMATLEMMNGMQKEAKE